MSPPFKRSRLGQKYRMLVLIVALALLGSVVADGVVTPELVAWVKGKYGDEAEKRMQGWQRLISENQQQAEEQKLRLVNDFFNELTYRSDLNIWGQEDYWATPAESLGKGQADCEDYSIAKYFTLRELGVSEDKMRITYVKALELNQAHMVLSYYPQPNSVPLVLDNLKADILSATKRFDLAPVYSFNAEGLWLAKRRGSGKWVGTSERISLWNDLKARMQQELDN